MKKRPIFILFGGSFDPIHNGHLAVAAYAQSQLHADRVVFIPARRSPHKPDAPQADGPARLAMIRLAIAGYPCFEACDCELNRSEPSYTLDTVEHFRLRYGQEAELLWLIGADMVAGLPKWHHVKDLLTVCRLCVMYRGGMEKPNLAPLVSSLGYARVAQLEKDILETPLVDISSTDLRARIAAGRSIADQVPASVLRYIEQNGLYQSPQNSSPCK